MRSIILATLLFATTTLAQIPLRQQLSFTHACSTGEKFILMGVGDVLLHGPLQTQAAQRRDYSTLWEQAVPYARNADVAYANFEGPAAPGITKTGRTVADPGWTFDNNVYSGYPLFNFHPESARALADDGFDVLGLANNHSLDRGPLGLERTIETMNSVGVTHVGTRTRDSNWTVGRFVSRGNLRTGWIACAFMTNGIPDRHEQVLSCLRDKELILRTIRRNVARADAIIVTPHWGNEYQQQPDAAQKQFARDVVGAGAKLVIGNHPHVLQPMEKLQGPAGEALVAYSLGNFVSNQPEMTQQATALMFVGLTKTARGTHINGVKFLPAAMQRSPFRTLNVLGVDQRASAHARHVQSVFADAHLVWRGQEIVPNDGCRRQ